MCNYNTLSNTEHGYIIKCASCNHIQLTFGTTIATFSYAGFTQFNTVLNNLLDEHKAIDDTHVKSIKVPLESKQVMMICSYNELVQLRALTSGAVSQLQYQQLFSFCNN